MVYIGRQNGTVCAMNGDFSTLAGTMALLLDLMCMISLPSVPTAAVNLQLWVSAVYLKQSLHAASPSWRRGLQTLCQESQLLCGSVWSLPVALHSDTCH